MAAILKRIHTGTVTLGGTNTEVVFLDQSIDISKSFVFASSQASGVLNHYFPMVRFRLEEVSGIKKLVADRITGGGTAEFTYYVVEFLSGINVQRGSLTQSDFTDTGTFYEANALITAVNPSRAFPILYFQPDSTALTANESVVAEINTPTNVYFYHDDATTNGCDGVDYEIVEFLDNTEVQFYSGSFTTVLEDIPITTVDLSKSIVLINFSLASNAPDANDYFCRAYFLDDSTVRIERNSLGPTMYYGIHVVEFEDAIVKSGNLSLTTSDLTKSGSFSGFNSDNGLAFLAGYGNYGGTLSSTNEDHATSALFQITSLTDTGITIERGATNTASSEVTYFALEFPTERPPGNPIVLSQDILIGSTSITNTNDSVEVPLPDLNDLNRSILTFGVILDSSSGSESRHALVIGELYDNLGTITARFTRFGTSGNITIHYRVAEFSSGILVQRGVTSFSTASATQVISQINYAKSFPIISASSDTANPSGDDSIRVIFLDKTTLQFDVSPSDLGPVSVAWQVVTLENDGLVFNLRSSFTTSDTEPVPLNLNLSRTAQFFTYLNTSIEPAILDLDEFLVRGRLDISGNLVVSRFASSGVQVLYSTFLVDFGSNVETSALTDYSLNNGLSQINGVSSPSLVDERTLFFTGGLYGYGGISAETAPDYESAFGAVTAYTPPNFTFDVGGTVANRAFSIQGIQFPVSSGNVVGPSGGIALGNFLIF